MNTENGNSKAPAGVKLPIYMDNHATTPVDPRVLEEMMPFLTENYGNPSSGYRFGKLVKDALAQARERVATLLGCEPAEVIFTSCGTESTNAAIDSGYQPAVEEAPAHAPNLFPDLLHRNPPGGPGR